MKIQERQRPVTGIWIDWLEKAGSLFKQPVRVAKPWPGSQVETETLPICQTIHNR
jgi:hypothetical protein